MGTSKNSKISFSLRANLCTQVLALIAAYYLRPFSRAPQGIKEKAGMRGYKLAFFYFFPLTQTLSLWRGLFSVHQRCVHRLAHWERVFLEVPL
jgi:hypothetical protein